MITEIKSRPSDLARVRTPDDHPLVITLNIHGINACKVLVDGGSSANMFFWQTFKRMWLNENNMLANAKDQSILGWYLKEPKTTTEQLNKNKRALFDQRQNAVTTATN